MRFKFLQPEINMKGLNVDALKVTGMVESYVFPNFFLVLFQYKTLIIAGMKREAGPEGLGGQQNTPKRMRSGRDVTLRFLLQSKVRK